MTTPQRRHGPMSRAPWRRFRSCEARRRRNAPRASWGNVGRPPGGRRHPRGRTEGFALARDQSEPRARAGDLVGSRAGVDPPVVAAQTPARRAPVIPAPGDTGDG